MKVKLVAGTKMGEKSLEQFRKPVRRTASTCSVLSSKASSTAKAKLSIDVNKLKQASGVSIKA